MRYTMKDFYFVFANSGIIGNHVWRDCCDFVCRMVHATKERYETLAVGSAAIMVHVI